MQKMWIVTGIIFLSFSHFAQALELKEVWQINSGLAEPESVHYNAATQMLYISNVNGAPPEKDGNGYITKAVLDGRVIEEIWAQGLDAPKGMGTDADSLYVTDINRIVKIDKESGRIKRIFPIEKSKFLNDIAVSPEGTVYVSDMFDDAIYRIVGNHVALWLKNSQLRAPNGLYVQGSSIILGSWGQRSEGFSTTELGQLQKIDSKSRAFEKMGDAPFANCDGVSADADGGYWVSEFTSGKIFHVDASGEPTLVLTLSPGTADLEYVEEKDWLLIPNMNKSTVTAYQIIRSQEKSLKEAESSMEDSRAEQ